MWGKEHQEKSTEDTGPDLDRVSVFADLFDFINSHGLNGGCKNAYDDAVSIAKGLVDSKDRSSWDGTRYEDEAKEKYPDLRKEFISSLRHCIENYNPPVNIPHEPLW